MFCHSLIVSSASLKHEHYEVEERKKWKIKGKVEQRQSIKLVAEDIHPSIQFNSIQFIQLIQPSFGIIIGVNLFKGHRSVEVSNSRYDTNWRGIVKKREREREKGSKEDTPTTSIWWSLIKLPTTKKWGRYNNDNDDYDNNDENNNNGITSS